MNLYGALDRARLKALIFDVDGTLYPQTRLRAAVVLRLLRAYAFKPVEGARVLRILRAYRGAQERLRSRTAPHPDLAGAQLDAASEVTGATRAAVEECVARWIEREPLGELARLTPPELVDLLGAARRRGLKLAVFSDYPPADKLDALGVRGRFDVVAWAQQPDVGAFKPDPRGLRAVLARLALAPDQALYIGDRADTDGGAAQAAGVPCAIVSGARDLGALAALLFASGGVLS